MIKTKIKLLNLKLLNAVLAMLTMQIIIIFHDLHVLGVRPLDVVLPRVLVVAVRDLGFRDDGAGRDALGAKSVDLVLE